MERCASLKPELNKLSSQAFMSCEGFTHVRNMTVAGEGQEVTFRAAQHGAMLRAASELLNDRYAWRGYGSSHSIPSGVHHTTFTAEVDGEVVGTITLAVDSERGLAIDQTFPDELDRIRNIEQARICELTRLAFHSSVRSKEVLAALFHFTFIVGTTISRCTDLLIEVGPRHTAFYETMLRFERIGQFQTNTSVGSLSQLMGLKVSSIRDNIRQFAGNTSEKCSRSMYAYFLPQPEETLIRDSLLTSHKRKELSFCLPKASAKARKTSRNGSTSSLVSKTRLLSDLGGGDVRADYSVFEAA